MKEFDVVVIGDRPGAATSSAIRCAQLGLRTACVERWRDAEGQDRCSAAPVSTWAAFPSKALLDSSHHYYNLRHLLPAHGITRRRTQAIDVARDAGDERKRW